MLCNLRIKMGFCRLLWLDMFVLWFGNRFLCCLNFIGCFCYILFIYRCLGGLDVLDM